jgi:hypothetical protein
MSAALRQARSQSGPVVYTEGHHFQLTGGTSVDDLLAQITAPLSVILQVTKRCDFDCNFCSEILQLPDPTLAQLIWNRYRFKRNHVAKYLGASIHTTQRGCDHA